MLVPDLILYTDGSGHEDGYGGYAAYVKTPDNLVQKFVMGALSETSVDRSEFTALVEGLRLAFETWRRFPGCWESQWPEPQVLKKPNITWYSDRESLVLSVKNVNSRENCKDLWAMFDHFAAQMNLTAFHITEEEKAASPEFCACDLHSSSARIMMRDYYASVPMTLMEDIPEPKKKSKKKNEQSTSEASVP